MHCVWAAPSVERLSFRLEKNGRIVPIVKLEAIDGSVPLGSLGEGLRRMLGIALCLVTARDGLLLVDEIDTGLYYSVLPDMWKLVFEVARRLNVQVFATTHSWDCISAFSQAQQEDTQN